MTPDARVTDERLAFIIEIADAYAESHGSDNDHDITKALRDYARLRAQGQVDHAALCSRLQDKIDEEAARKHDAGIVELLHEAIDALSPKPAEGV